MTGLFSVLCLLLFYLVWTYDCRKSALWVGTALFSVALFVFFGLLYNNTFSDWRKPSFLWPVAFLLAGAVCTLLFLNWKRVQQNLSGTSIKEAMDNLSMAGCYFLENGRVKICNRQMYQLIFSVSGRELQSYQQLRDTLEHSVPKTADGSYLFPDHTVWHFAERQFQEDGVSYTEAILLNVTDLYYANEELASETQELQRINQKLQKMYARAEDRIREREYLHIKMKIHDQIGKSLTVIRQFLQKDLPEETMRKQLQNLSVAVGTLVYSPDADSADPYDVLLSEAADLGVEIKLDGMLPLEPALYDMTVAATRECLTNCVRHAHGTTVFLFIHGLPGGYQIEIRNDGIQPKEPIVEGGGLSTLRRCVESAGGAMKVVSMPTFLLQLTFLREEMDL